MSGSGLKTSEIIPNPFKLPAKQNRTFSLLSANLDHFPPTLFFARGWGVPKASYFVAVKYKNVSYPFSMMFSPPNNVCIVYRDLPPTARPPLPDPRWRSLTALRVAFHLDLLRPDYLNGEIIDGLQIRVPEGLVFFW